MSFDEGSFKIGTFGWGDYDIPSYIVPEGQVEFLIEKKKKNSDYS